MYVELRVADQFELLQKAVESAIEKSAEKTVQKINETIYTIETTKIVTASETWTKRWAEALEAAKGGDNRDVEDLKREFRTGETSAANRLNLLHNYLMGEGGLGAGDSSGGYVATFKKGIFERL
jgi:hypothetical protein